MRQPKTSRKGQKVVKDKFLTVVDNDYVPQHVMPKLEAQSTNQKKQLAFLQEGRPIVLAAGAAGTGKSIIAAYHGAKLLKEKKIDKIWLVRPNVVVGNTIGLLPGNIDEKLTPFFVQTFAHFEKFLGKGFLKYCKEKKIIEMAALEHLRGFSFENSYVILEECQGLKAEEFELIMTRIGEGAQFCLTGDQKQAAKKDQSGLGDFIKMLEDVLYFQPDYLDAEDLKTFSKDIGIVKYEPKDNVRSGTSRAFTKLYHFRNP